MESVRYNPTRWIDQRTHASVAIQQLCERNRVTRESIEESRPLQRLLLAALYESRGVQTTELSTAAVGGSIWRPWFSLDLVELVVAQLDASRSCPPSGARHQRLSDSFDWHVHQLWLLGYS